MKKFLIEAKRVLSIACVLNTVLITFLYTVGKLISPNWIPRFGMMWIILGISVVFGIAERVFVLGETSFLPLLGHFGISLVGFVLIFVVGGGYAKSGGQLFIAMFLFFIAYSAIMGVRMGVRSAINRKKNDREEYSSMFDENKKKVSRKK
ncbi:MAG: hypothetical protein IKM46_05285 [Clostridia bacterium]|nr:hypothetical protein [Clostridia bacterium]